MEQEPQSSVIDRTSAPLEKFLVRKIAKDCPFERDEGVFEVIDC